MVVEGDRGAVVLGDNISIVQELGRNGIDCTVMMHHRAPSTFSRYVRYVHCPDPSIHEDKAIGSLGDLCRRRGDRPVVIPASDQWVMALSRHRELVEEFCVPCVANREAVELILDKERFCRLGHAKGYMTPRCWGCEDLGRLGEDEFPILAKPRLHRWSSNDARRSTQDEMVRLRFTVIHDLSELDRFLEREEGLLGHLFFQELVRGPTSNLYSFGAYVDRSSSILASVSGHKIRGCMTNHGDCNLGERTTLPEEMVITAERIIADLGITGLIEFEYKIDSRTGESRLVEVNPRPWSWIGMAPACGVDLPLIAYRDLTGALEPPVCSSFQGSVKFVRLSYDLPNCLVYHRKDSNGWGRSLGEWRNDVKADRLVLYEAGAGDWLVSTVLAVEALQSMGGYTLRAITKRFRP